jgi:urease accessory protein
MFDFLPDEPEESCDFPSGPQLAGKGILEMSFVAGRTEATRAFAANPLRLLVPRRRTAAAWVYVGTYGGGLVAGDEIDLRVRIGARARGVLSTQASTKVYRNLSQVPSRQTLRASVADGGLLVVAPDPLTCFAQARYEQLQSVRLHGSGSLVLVDWLTSGRRARGESWALSRYCSRLQVYRDDELVLADALLLDPADGPLDSPFRLGRFHCLATVVLIGEQLAAAVADQLGRVAAKPVQAQSPLVDVASPLRPASGCPGLVLRVIGETTEMVSRYLAQAMAFLNDLLGEGPWARKW